MYIQTSSAFLVGNLSLLTNFQKLSTVWSNTVNIAYFY